MGKAIVLVAVIAFWNQAHATPWTHERPSISLEVPPGFAPATPSALAGLKPLQAWTNGDTTLGVYQAEHELSKQRSSNLDLAMRSPEAKGIVSSKTTPWGDDTIDVVTDMPIASPGEPATWIHEAWLPVRGAAIVIVAIAGHDQRVLVNQVVATVKADSSWHPASESTLYRVISISAIVLVLGFVAWKRRRKAAT